MPNSPSSWIALSVFLTLVLAIVLLLVGCVMEFIPGMLSRAQQCMRAGAAIVIVLIFVGGILGATAFERDGVNWVNIGLIGLYALVGLGVPWLWKKLVRRR